MDEPDISRTRFVRDETSRVLALTDALASAHGAAVSNAFLEVARARGLALIAADAGLSIDAIYAALADRANPDLAILARVVAAMGSPPGLPSRSND